MKATLNNTNIDSNLNTSLFFDVEDLEKILTEFDIVNPSVRIYYSSPVENIETYDIGIEDFTMYIDKYLKNEETPYLNYEDYKLDISKISIDRNELNSK